MKVRKDPNKPKKPLGAFFLFMVDFRKSFKARAGRRPYESAKVASQAGGEKWRNMSAADKAPYLLKADKLKTEYAKNMRAYYIKQRDNGDAEQEPKTPKTLSQKSDDGGESEERRKQSSGNAETFPVNKVTGHVNMFSTSDLLIRLKKILSPDKGKPEQASDPHTGIASRIPKPVLMPDASSLVNNSKSLPPSPACPPCQGKNKRNSPSSPIALCVTKKPRVNLDNEQNISLTKGTIQTEEVSEDAYPPFDMEILESVFSEKLCESVMIYAFKCVCCVLELKNYANTSASDDLSAARNRFDVLTSRVLQMKIIQRDLHRTRKSIIKDFLDSNEFADIKTDFTNKAIQELRASKMFKKELDVHLEEFKRSDEHKKVLVDHLKRYKKSEDYRKELAKHLLMHKDSEDYKNDLANHLENYKCSDEHKRVLADYLEKYKKSEAHRKDLTNHLVLHKNSEEYKKELANHLENYKCSYLHKKLLDTHIQEYKASNEHKKLLADHLETYKKSEDNKKDLTKHLLLHKNSEEYKKELANHLEKYKGSQEYKKALADHLEEYKASDVHKRVLADHLQAFKKSEVYQKDMTRYLTECLLRYKNTEEYKKALANHLEKYKKAFADHLEKYRDSEDHKKVLGDHLERYKRSEDYKKDLTNHLVLHQNSEEYKKELANHLEKYKGSREHKKALADHLEGYKTSSLHKKLLADHLERYKSSNAYKNDLNKHLLLHKDSEEYKKDLANYLEKYKGSKAHKKDLTDYLEKYKKSEEYQKALVDHENTFLHTKRCKDIVAEEVVRSFMQGVSTAQCRIYDALRKRFPDFDTSSWGLPIKIEDPTGDPPPCSLVDEILPAHPAVNNLVKY
ncbi:unnamed protein product [Cuscuta epithymum]|uniref:HMG box domain-containing protein n=1 Tax=Cuscuta epithymum TaxID=186058 RepID=A0AAV0DJK4_9ASTE|nr:unnamed protein product [Cuscuta epithymum]